MTEPQAVSTQDEVSEVEESHKTNYNAIRSEVEKPFGERSQVPSGRNGGMTTLRKYHLTDAEKTKIVERHKALGGGDIVNPLAGRSGVYYAQVEALIRLGINKWHSHKVIRDMMEKIMSGITKKRKRGEDVIETDAWTDFYGKAGRDGAEKPKDGDGKIIQNFKVLQRLPKPDGRERNPYGLKLAQFCMCVDIEFRAVAEGIDPIPHFRLNTEWENEEDVLPTYSNPTGRKRRKKAEKQDDSDDASASNDVVPEVNTEPEVVEEKSSETEVEA